MSASRIEPITYWSKVGDEVVQGSAARKWTEMRLGLRGYTADGLLFRISSIDSNTARAFERQGQFVQELMTTLDASQRKSLAAL
jgi:EpsI family protein